MVLITTFGTPTRTTIQQLTTQVVWPTSATWKGAVTRCDHAWQHLSGPPPGTPHPPPIQRTQPQPNALCVGHSPVHAAWQATLEHCWCLSPPVERGQQRLSRVNHPNGANHLVRKEWRLEVTSGCNAQSTPPPKHPTQPSFIRHTHPTCALSTQ